MTARSESGERGAGSGQSGFALVTAIFILVVLAGLGAAMVSISTAQHTTVAMDIQSARAYQAARAGIEWGAYQTLKVANACSASPSTLTFAGTPLASFTATVTCSSTTHSEGANTVTLFVLTSNAIYGTPGTPDYVAREVGTRIARCVDSGGAAC
ncbi:MAG: hypothetical protein A2Z01_02470 [Betaproteobacteria bacterium RBG_16_58_11]|nr:MAG: hypothetical protein A2Z01_02470 [Betaproteobacteria bacterium RBG_16_58_11]